MKRVRAGPDRRGKSKGLMSRATIKENLMSARPQEKGGRGGEEGETVASRKNTHVMIRVVRFDAECFVSFLFYSQQSSVPDVYGSEMRLMRFRR